MHIRGMCMQPVHAWHSRWNSRVLFDHNFKEFEVGIIANLMPESAEEARLLVPSLKVCT